MSKEYTLVIDPPLFKKQRLTLGNIISYWRECNLLPEEEVSDLEGIQSLLDDIADQAHDNYGLDVLNCENEGIYETDK